MIELDENWPQHPNKKEGPTEIQTVIHSRSCHDCKYLGEHKVWKEVEYGEYGWDDTYCCNHKKMQFNDLGLSYATPDRCPFLKPKI